MNIIITGSGGFVGGHLTRKLKEKFSNSSIYGLYRKNIKTKVNGINYFKIDLNDNKSLKHFFLSYKPDYLIHLAAESSVTFSWKNPVSSLQNNLNIYLNILEVLREVKISPRILSIGSSEVYGRVIKEDLPLSEETKLNPLNPYAVFRVAQENISKVYNDSYGSDIIMTRSFNHYGIGQDNRFFIPNLIYQVLDNKIKEIRLGNLQIIRDYIYIDDVVNAYVDLLIQGRKNNIYNISTGLGYKLKDILDILNEIIPIKKPIISDLNLIRPSDNPVIIGDNSKIKKEINWNPEISIKDGLNKIVTYLKENGTYNK